MAMGAVLKEINGVVLEKNILELYLEKIGLFWNEYVYSRF